MASSHCNRNPKCLICGNEHTTDNCPSNPKTNTNLTNDQVIAAIKCALCDGNHIANSTECPNRSRYIEVRRKSQRNFRPQRNPQREFNLNNQQWPSISRQNMSGNSVRPTPTSSQWNPPPREQLQTNPTYAYATQHSSEDLLSVNDLLLISKEVISRLGACRDRADQLQVIFDISLKYLPT